MPNNLKDKAKDIFGEFVINLIEMFQEIWERVVNQKSFRSLREVMAELNSKPTKVFFWAGLKKNEILIDYLAGQLNGRRVEVVIQKGQHRLERKMLKWGNNPEMPWLVLEDTAIGAREGWWKSQAALDEITLKIDADT